MIFKPTPEKNPVSPGELNDKIEEAKASIEKIYDLLEKNPELKNDPEIQKTINQLEVEIKTQLSFDKIKELLEENPALRSDPRIQAELNNIQNIFDWKNTVKELKSLKKELELLKKKNNKNFF